MDFKKEITSITDGVISTQGKIMEIQQLCQSQINSINAGITIVSKKVVEQEEKIGEIAAENSALKKDVSTLKKEVESIKIRARQKNLMIYGIKEEAGETKPALKQKVCEIIKKFYGMASVIIIDLPTRLPPGAPLADSEKSRPVLVCFSLKSDRDSILYRKVPDCPIVVKADLPPETAAKRHILGKLTTWAKENNVKFRRTDHYVEMNTTRYNHLEAKDFLEAFADRRQSGGNNGSGSPMEVASKTVST